MNLIAPDTTPSETSRNTVSAEIREQLGINSPELVARSYGIYVPMGEAPPAEALGDAVLFLAPDLSAWITGSVLHVDGGTGASLGFLHWPGPVEWAPSPPARLLRDDAFG